MRGVYNILLLIVAVPGLVYFLLKMLVTGKYRNSFLQKLAGRQKHILDAVGPGRRIWIHAVSVGEVTAAAPIVAALERQDPALRVIVSTSTETGQGMARNLFDVADAFIYFPLDLPFAVKRMLGIVRPDVFVLVETELWPNFLAGCRARGISVILANGRISPRSFDAYFRTRFFWRRALVHISEAGMISHLDAERITRIGMASAKTSVLGNAKYDALAAMAAPNLHEETRRRFNVAPDEKFLVAGSTHPGEEDIVIRTYLELKKVHPEWRLILVPRHIERTPEVLDLLSQYGLNDILTVTAMRGGRGRQGEAVIVVDVIGELFKVYSLAEIVYCGGSLVPRGGQNILEAAAWGKVVLYGPSMDDFSQEAALLEEAGAGVRVADARELLQRIGSLLDDPQDLRRRGEKGRAVVRANMGAANRYAQLIGRYLDRKSG